jgi:hypothetical protein
MAGTLLVCSRNVRNCGDARRRVSRVLSRRRRIPNGDGHSSGTPVAERLVRPTRAAARRFARFPQKSGSLPPLLGLAPGGVFPAVAVAGGAVRSYRTVSPLPSAGNSGRTGGVLSVALSLGSPPPGITRHRTSVEPGLSSLRTTRRAAIRPSGGRDVVRRGAFVKTASLLNMAGEKSHRRGCLRQPARCRPRARRSVPRRGP